MENVGVNYVKAGIIVDIYFNAKDAAGGKKYKDVILGVIEEIIKTEGFINTEICVTLTDNPAIKELNRQYRHIDRETDCLSFPQYERDELDILDKSKCHMLGDVVISFEKAVSQAEEYGHSIERELAFLAAHSTLHLLGYDHETGKDEKIMLDKQEYALNKLKYLRDSN